MVSPRTKSIFLFVVALGLVLGPISYFLTQNAPEPTNPPIDDNSTPPTEFPTIKQSKRYMGEANGMVVSKEESIFLIGFSNYGNEEAINASLLNISGVEQVNISKQENSGETGLYAYTIQLKVKPENTERVGYFLMTTFRAPPFSFTFDSIGVPAKVNFPPEVLLAKYPSGELSNITMPEEVPAYIFTYTNNRQVTTFAIDAIFSGGKLQVVALENPRVYKPPTDTEYELGEAEVLNVTGYGFSSDVDYEETVEASEVEAMLLSNGVNATIVYSEPNDFFFVTPENSFELVQALNVSGVKAEEQGTDVKVFIGNLTETLAVLDEASPGLDYSVPKGLLLVSANQSFVYSAEEPVKIYSLTPGEMSVEHSTGCFFIEKYADTICRQMPADVQEGELFPVNITVKSVFGGILHPVIAKPILG
ncbi:hypothetical protein K8R43_05795 [archaeon]|nr:hypothetical protein [archaeon]